MNDLVGCSFKLDRIFLLLCVDCDAERIDIIAIVVRRIFQSHFVHDISHTCSLQCPIKCKMICQEFQWSFSVFLLRKHMFLLLTSYIEPQESRLYYIEDDALFNDLHGNNHTDTMKNTSKLCGQVSNSDLIVPELFKRLEGARCLININITSEDLPLLKLLDVEEVSVIQSEIEGAHVLFHPVFAEALRDHARSFRYSPLECNLSNTHVPYHVTTTSCYA